MRRSVLLLASLVSMAGTAGAQEIALSERGPRFLLASTGRQRAVEIDPAKAPIFQRRVTLALEHATVGEALAAVGHQAGIRVVYSRDVLDPAAPARIKAEGITVAGALTEILLDARVDVVLSDLNRVTLAPRMLWAPPPTGAVVGRVTNVQSGEAIEGAEVYLQGTRWRTLTGTNGEYRLADVDTGTYVATARRIGYAKQTQPITVAEGQEATADFGLLAAVTKLDELVTTGTVVPTEVKAVPSPITVVTEADIALQRPQTIQEVFKYAVPTGVSFDRLAVPSQASFSARGASTLSPGIGQMKVFIDGIEVAWPTFAPVDPNSIERMEVIRGPQASAIYGSDAIGGVIQIFTKRGDPNLERPQVGAEAALGISETPYPGYRGVLRQEYRASVRGGGPELSYNFGAGYSHLGDYVPSGDPSAQSSPSVYGGLRYSRGIVTVDVSGRYYTQNTPQVVNPALVQTGALFFSKPFYRPTQYQSQTYGARITVAPLSWWQSTVTAGVDRLVNDVAQSQPRLTTPQDTLLRVFYDSRTKTSIGYTTTVQGALGPDLSGSLTAGFDHWSLPLVQISTSNALTTSGTIQIPPGRSISASRTITNNTGYFAQMQLGFRGALFLTAGLRAEENTDFGDSLGTPVSPRVGLSFAQQAKGTTLKFRGSYGRAIRAPSAGQKIGSVAATSVVLPNPVLGPERQNGWDAGVDLVFGSRGSLGVTYYDQAAENLIQFVELAANPVRTSQYQNVGRVNNTGVEVEGTVFLGLLRLRAQYGYARAHVAQLAANYTGDLRVGDQTLQTPKHTAGASLTVTPFKGTTVATGLTYVGKWNYYDDVAQQRCAGGTGTCYPSLREYTIAYPGVVKTNASVTQQLTPILSGFIAVANLTNEQAFESSNLVPVMGRVSTVGLQFRY